MDEEFELIESPLSQRIIRDGISVEVFIYRGKGEKGWTLEVVDEDNGSTVWDGMFATEQDALAEVMKTIDVDGIRSFFSDPLGKVPRIQLASA